MKISRNSAKICRIPEIHFANLVDLEKSEKMSIWTQKSASIQPRTSCVKFGCGPPRSNGPQRKRDAGFPSSSPAGCRPHFQSLSSSHSAYVVATSNFKVVVILKLFFREFAIF